eukprot:GGOE01007121.1.p1 GENE.GGOE01007121.1~~GGOE01007121.1.p1  ORF type:complete len:397 (-),score=100.62 GGOE01007121.1:509-1699(-)
MDKGDDGEPRRNHGLEWPLHPFQVAAWVLLLFFPIMFGVFTGPFLRSPHSYIWITLYPIAYVATVITDILAVKSDPVDPASLVKLTPEQMMEEPPADQNPCYYCKAFVHESSKHCRSCNKCILDFDHHCKWLNNCVGGKNYRLFLAFVMATVVALSMQIGLITFQFIDSFYDPWYAWRAKSLYSMDLTLWQGIVGAVAGLALIADSLLMHLCGFHAWLAIEGLSTYDWILKRREERRKAKREKKEASRVVEVEEVQPAEAHLEAAVGAGAGAVGKATPRPSTNHLEHADVGICNTPVTAMYSEHPQQLSLPARKAEQRVIDGYVQTPHYLSGAPHLVSEAPAAPYASRLSSDFYASPAQEEDEHAAYDRWPRQRNEGSSASLDGCLEQRFVSVEVY